MMAAAGRNRELQETEVRRAGKRLWLARIAAGALIAYGFYFVFTCAAIVTQAGQDEAKRADVIVVFGAAEYKGRPSPVFRARLDHAFELYKRKLASVVITTGGSGGEVIFTEGRVGHDYLVGRGIGDRHLIAETQSDNSAQSAERVATIMEANGMRSCIAVSDPYHEFRIKRLLEARGIEVYTSPRPLETTPAVVDQAVNVAREALSYTLWRLHLYRP